MLGSGEGGGGRVSPFHSTMAYKWLNLPLGTHRPIRVVCIGTGYSGMMMSIIAKEKMEAHEVDFHVYEKNKDLGGTWLVNRYPGCQCDIPAHNYAYSFDPKPDWPGYYATSEQIFHYMKAVSARHGCDDLFSFEHEVVAAVWNDADGLWKLKVKHKGTEIDDYCHVLINAGGVLDSWKWPDIPGIARFKGRLMHSADWDGSFNFARKRLAVIGIGSSGIQILPQVAKEATHVDYFVRSPTWITPERGAQESREGDPELDADYQYAPAEIEHFFKEPEYLQNHRKILANRRIEEFRSGLGNVSIQEKVQQEFSESMAARLGTSEKGRRLADLLIPTFPVGCRRLTPGQGFLEALMKPSVDTHWNNLQEITEDGILLKSGETLELDAIICATGFDTSFKPRFSLIGKGGVELTEKWELEEPEAYFGIAVPNMPNYFCFIGPNSPISNGSLVQAIQMTGVYIYNCITKLQTQGIKSMTISNQAVRHLNTHAQSWLRDTVWAASCRSWYKQGTTDGRNIGLYCGSCFHFVEALRDPRWEDYDFEYLGSNRFEYLGNGLTVREQRGGDIGDTQTVNFDAFWNLMILPEIYG
ncbi:hypothetical protein BDV26DRAFT_299342 [Aspergillus bertholletiae]|uniref:Cyclohexanone monooxygenase n=1 Tax=Aspergillus bertholletiae TaxID=1226010 RepID=A0A5N7BQX6_9EURO|nr:hypothetical protein BDV26DRAFT_299342 [Aspergillus bertholletiae]